MAVRTPLTKAKRGGMKDTPLDYMILHTLKALLSKSALDPNLVEDVCLGNVGEVRAAYIIRAASLAAGIPHSACASVVNRFCSSGLQAVQDIARSISSGSIDCGIAIGAESMTTSNAATAPDFSPFHPTIMKCTNSAECTQSMGQTSENVAQEFHIDRQSQDHFAAMSFEKAEHAQRQGWFDDEIFPFTTSLQDPTTGHSQEVVLTKDEGIRYHTTFDVLQKIKPAFPAYGNRSTAGNSSQITDGAAAILLMKRSTAVALGQRIMAKFVGATVAGVPPRIMGIGPTAAIPKLLSKYNLSISRGDIDLVEINEAFASMAVYCQEQLKIPADILNVRGGAIALGHPLGATGARQICTGLSECRRRRKKVLLTSMCVGTGQGMAALFVNEEL